MTEKSKIVAIIPARGGSKSIPRKNIIDLNGKPLIAWTIEAALKSKLLDRVIVTTDDEEIAEVSKKYGAETPFMRPKELAEDKTPTLPVIQHAMNWFKENEGIEYDSFALLEPTSPARQGFHIDEAIKIFNEKGADSVVSVVKVPGHYNPHWQFLVGDNMEVSCFTGESIKNIIPRRQELPDVYTRNGSVYVSRSKNLLDNPPSFYGDKVYAYIMDDKYSVDIDSLADLEEASKKIKELNEKK